jgi:hypothetical protein
MMHRHHGSWVLVSVFEEWGVVLSLSLAVFVVISLRRRCVVSSLHAVFIVPLHLRAPSPSLSVVKEKTTRNNDIESPFLVWLPRRQRRRRGTWF